MPTFTERVASFAESLGTALRDSALRTGAQGLRSAGRIVEATVSDPWAAPDRDENDWYMLSNGGRLRNLDGKSLDATTREDLRRRARLVSRYTPHGKAIIKTYRKYVVGRKVSLKLPEVSDNGTSEDEKLAEVISEIVKEFYRDLKWRTFCKELLTRIIRDGEVFIWLFREKNGGAYTGRLFIRFVDPELIRAPSGYRNGQGEEGGIVTRGDDVETPVAYLKVRADQTDTLDARIPARDMLHYKLNVDSNEKRGETSLAPVIGYIQSYTTWLRDRLILNKIRSNIALVRIFDTTASKLESYLSNEASRQDSARSTRGGVKPARNTSVRQTQIRPGTTINATKAIDYKFLTPNLQAADVAHDGRAITLAIAAGTGLAEFMVTGDASNANYSSTLVSEASPTKEFEELQDMHMEILTDLWAVKVEVARRRDPILSEYDPYDAEWNYPPVVARDRLKDRQADKIMVDAKALSSQTMMERDGIEDPEQEKERIRKEAEERAAAFPSPLDMGGDPEEDLPGTDEEDELETAEEARLRIAYMVADRDRVRRLVEAVAGEEDAIEALAAGDIPPGFTAADVHIALETLSHG